MEEKSKKFKNICCPMCFGSGKIFPAKIKGNTIDERKIEVTKILHKKGYSLREITLLLGYKNVNSITHILKKIKL